ncbi:MAG TPA: hypothetical protein VG328_05460 [Stellaceae bacterium]|jgi:hypothetical protein|nr:hypothetical protein [Stellaceae bacterium]
MPRNKPSLTVQAENLAALVDVPRTAAGWSGVIADISAKLAAAVAEDAESSSDDTDLDLCFSPNAEALAVQRADHLRHVRERIDFLKRALARAQQKREQAAQAESLGELDRRTAHAQSIAKELIRATSLFDNTLAAANSLAAHIEELNGEMMRNQDITEVAAHRLNVTHNVRGAIAFAGEPLRRSIELPAVSPLWKQPLGDREARKWRRLLATPTKAGTLAEKFTAIEPNKRGAIEEEILRGRPDWVVDADDEPEVIEFKANRIKALTVERAEAVSE